MFILNLISKHHCSLRFDGADTVLEDTSSNGTFVNHIRVGGRKVLGFGEIIDVFGLKIICFGDMIAVGSLFSKFSVSDKIENSPFRKFHMILPTLFQMWKCLTVRREISERYAAKRLLLNRLQFRSFQKAFYAKRYRPVIYHGNSYGAWLRTYRVQHYA